MANIDEPIPEHQQDESDVDTSESLNHDARKECEEWKDAALRAKADYENLRRRMIARETELQHMAAERILHRVLPIIDDLQHAVEAASTTRDIEALVAGLTMIHDKAQRLLESEGVSSISVEAGEPFNVDVHEALLSQPSDHPEGHIVMALQRGYRLHDRVLRHAKVITSSGPVSEGSSS